MSDLSSISKFSVYFRLSPLLGPWGPCLGHELTLQPWNSKRNRFKVKNLPLAQSFAFRKFCSKFGPPPRAQILPEGNKKISGDRYTCKLVVCKKSDFLRHYILKKKNEFQKLIFHRAFYMAKSKPLPARVNVHQKNFFFQIPSFWFIWNHFKGGDEKNSSKGKISGTLIKICFSQN